jgi:hypothetical protein
MGQTIVSTTIPTQALPVPPEPADRADREAALRAALAERVLVLDGATGTALQGVELTADDFGGPELEGCNENLVLVRPDVVDRVHEGYLAAGCDVVETNTFGATPLVLAEYGLAAAAFEINRRAADRPRRLRPPRRPRGSKRGPGSRRGPGGSRRGPGGSRRGGRRRRPPPLRLRLDGADDEGDLGHRRRHLRGAARRTSASRRWG